MKHVFFRGLCASTDGGIRKGSLVLAAVAMLVFSTRSGLFGFGLVLLTAHASLMNASLASCDSVFGRYHCAEQSLLFGFLFVVSRSLESVIGYTNEISFYAHTHIHTHT